MSDIFSKPLRVYLVLGALALWGILSALQLPISLFPASSQTTVYVNLSYGNLSSEQFFDSIGRNLESRLHSIKSREVGVEKLKADYMPKSVRYVLRFNWGADSEEARRNVESAASSLVASYDPEIQRSLSVGSWKENSGFLAISFYSPLRSLDEIYSLLNPMVGQISSKVPDADGVGLYNPNQKELTIKLNPEKLAVFNISTVQVETALREGIIAYNGGTLQVGEKNVSITLPKRAANRSDLESLKVSRPGEPVILLRDVATLEVGVSEESRQKFKTSGVESLILFAQPKEGGNIKKMSDDIMRELKAVESQFPKDIQYKILVNPSDFINQSILGVLREVGLAALLAVVVLFIFIGSLKNVATAAIEIPLSLLMAFILMKITGMNLNLISLGGLALSAGMNVDASVVVLENIFRHFEGKSSSLSYQQRLAVIVGAVKEVWLPVLASTIASLVVFFPLIFTQGLTNALLGDLAKAVLFSHGLSAIVAFVLVPTIRLQIMAKGSLEVAHSPFEKQLKKLEAFYQKTLIHFLKSSKAQIIACSSLLTILPLLIFLVLPRLNKEVIGKPETDWLIVGISSPTLTQAKQMEAELDAMEEKARGLFGDQILYTFMQFHGTSWGNVMFRLKSRNQIEKLTTLAEQNFKNTPTQFYWVSAWNPSELEIPDPPNFRLEILGGSPTGRLQVAEDLNALFNEQSIYDNVSAEPSASRQTELMIYPNLGMSSQAEALSRSELSHYLRVATSGILLDHFYTGNDSLPIYLRTNVNSQQQTISALSALPFGFEGRLIPLGSIATFKQELQGPALYRENQKTLMVITGRKNKSNATPKEELEKKAHELVANYQSKLKTEDQPSVVQVSADKELTDALDQLVIAILISISLVFLVMVLQLGDIVHSLLVLLAVPLGMIGVVIVLYTFNSTLSLNSGLGTILLTGLAVANSIILVDFIRRKFQSGMDAFSSTVQASVTRLRPILMTSLTTVLGMLPVALGLGEGGKILQPLGISVTGGLWVSTFLTLFIVPALQYRYLHAKELKTRRNLSGHLASHDFVETPDIPSKDNSTNQLEF